MILEIRRQIIHALGIMLVLPLLFFEKTTAVFIIGTFLLLVILLALYRKTSKNMPKIIRYIASAFERKNEFPLLGLITFVFGSFAAAVLFEPKIAIISITVLALSDALSTIVGKTFGNHKLFINHEKSWEGSLAFFSMAFLVLSYFVSFETSVIIAVVSTIAEMLPKIDDNITVPIVVGILLTFI